MKGRTYRVIDGLEPLVLEWLGNWKDDPKADQNHGVDDAYDFRVLESEKPQELRPKFKLNIATKLNHFVFTVTEIL